MCTCTNTTTQNIYLFLLKIGNIIFFSSFIYLIRLSKTFDNLEKWIYSLLTRYKKDKLFSSTLSQSCKNWLAQQDWTKHPTNCRMQQVFHNATNIYCLKCGQLMKEISWFLKQEIPGSSKHERSTFSVTSAKSLCIPS